MTEVKKRPLVTSISRGFVTPCTTSRSSMFLFHCRRLSWLQRDASSWRHCTLQQSSQCVQLQWSSNSRFKQKHAQWHVNHRKATEDSLDKYCMLKTAVRNTTDALDQHRQLTCCQRLSYGVIISWIIIMIMITIREVERKLMQKINDDWQG